MGGVVLAYSKKEEIEETVMWFFAIGKWRRSLAATCCMSFDRFGNWVKVQGVDFAGTVTLLSIPLMLVDILWPTTVGRVFAGWAEIGGFFFRPRYGATHIIHSKGTQQDN
jgi:hypothetical protein